MRRWIPYRVLGVATAMMLVGLSARFAHADPRDFTLVNGSGVTIDEVYVGALNRADWGADILGQDVLPPGESVVITFAGFAPDDCLYDILLIDAERNGSELNQVNLCETDTVTFN
jgi:hypothetical protein